MENKKTNSLLIALLSSLAICVAGAIVWAILYTVGFFSAIISFATVACACVVYNKFHKINWLFFVWVGIWVTLLSILSMFIADSLLISSELNIGFGQSFYLLIKMIGTESEIANMMVSNIIWSVLFIIIGFCCSIGIIKKQNLKRQINNQQNNQPSEQTETVETSETTNDDNLSDNNSSDIDKE